MFRIKMADLIIEIDNKYDFTYNLCRDYITNECDHTDMRICINDEAIAKERSEGLKPDFYNEDYCESICIYRAISHELTQFDALLIHAACIEMKGRVYAFLAKSGVGKSTHLGLWLRHYGKDAHIINGDKPIIRRINDTYMVYGTPWCGKEGLNINTHAPLKALCFLERNDTNIISPLAADKVIPRLANQILIPNDSSAAKYLDLLDGMITSTPAYVLKCNMDEEAAVIAYEGMR